MTENEVEVKLAEHGKEIGSLKHSNERSRGRCERGTSNWHKKW